MLVERYFGTIQSSVSRESFDTCLADLPYYQWGSLGPLRTMGKLISNMLGLWWGYPTWRCTYVNLICGSWYNAIWMGSTILFVVVGNALLFSFFSSFVSTGFGLSVCYIVFQLCHMFLDWIFFPGIILNKCVPILFLLEFCVFNAVNDAIILHWHLLHSSLSGETSSWDSTLRKKKLCKRDGSGGRVLSGCPGCYLLYNRDVAIISFLLGILLASPVVG